MVTATQYIMALDITNYETEWHLEGKASALPFMVAKDALDASQLLSIHHAMENGLLRLMMVCYVLPLYFT
jgi:hypothetical protein